jgi:serine phosphatase RsbU (regulator of sigma subunit)/pSer/pThr/pTyr-binding forkhead associated (FHA) protein
MAALFVLEGPNPGGTIPLDRDCTFLGRSSSCHIVLDDVAVSREHSCIHCVDGHYYIEDLHSRNGTFVNDRVVLGRRRLGNQDRIKVCEFLFRFEGPPPEVDDGEPSTISDNPAQAVDDSSTVEAAVAPDELLRKGHSAQRLQALLELCGRMTRSLDVDELLGLVVESLFDLFEQADRGFVVLEDERTGTFEPRLVRTRRRKDLPAARYSRSLLRRCLETGQGLLSENNNSSQIRATANQSTVDLRVRSTMCVPLCGPDDRAFGALLLDTPDRLRKFTEEDLAFLMGVAQQTAVAVENARLHHDLMARQRMVRDLELAGEVTRGFLPQHMPEIPGYAFFAECVAALEVGGDYYDFIPLPGPRLAVMLGDVACKGVAAALLMAKLSSDVRLSLLTAANLPGVVARLNELLVGHVLQTDRFVTLTAGILDPVAHTLTLVSAGHPVPLVYRRATGAVEKTLPSDAVGIPLGVQDRTTYAAHTVWLEPGDCLVAFTDGITEAMNATGQLFRGTGIVAALTAGPGNAPGVGRRILEALKGHTAGQRQIDDLTMLCLSREG